MKTYLNGHLEKVWKDLMVSGDLSFWNWSMDAHIEFLVMSFDSCYYFGGGTHTL